MVRDGFCTGVRVVRLIDADTMEVEVKRHITVRLIHPNQYGKIIFDCPEKNTELGQEAIKFVQELLDNFLGTVRMFVPANDPIDMLDSITFNRTAAEIWLNDRNLAEILVENGFGRLIHKDNRTCTPWP